MVRSFGLRVVCAFGRLGDAVARLPPCIRSMMECGGDCRDTRRKPAAPKKSKSGLFHLDRLHIARRRAWPHPALVSNTNAPTVSTMPAAGQGRTR